MQVQLLVERNQSECVVKLAGTAYTFKRNEYGHFVADILSADHMAWVNDPNHSGSFKVYITPEKTIIDGRKDGTMEQTRVKVMSTCTPNTGKKDDAGINIPERREGRPRAAESYQKVTVTLYDRQILSLDKAVLVIRERTGQAVNRAELIRAILDKAAGSLNPEARDFDKNIRGLFPILGFQFK
jgi:hypothetical protein